MFVSYRNTPGQSSCISTPEEISDRNKALLLAVILTIPGLIGVRKNPYSSQNLSLAMVLQHHALEKFSTV